MSLCAVRPATIGAGFGPALFFLFEVKGAIALFFRASLFGRLSGGKIQDQKPAWAEV